MLITKQSLKAQPLQPLHVKARPHPRPRVKASNPPTKTFSTQVVGMKGKSKHRKYRDYESDEELFGQSPSSSMFTYDESYASSSMMIRDFKEIAVKPRNPTQERYFKLLEDQHPSIVIAFGPAGTGKTMIACHVGIKNLQQGNVSKLVLTRPAVSVEEQHGFLPGTLEEKMEPWLKPVFDVFHQYYSPQKVQNMIKNQILEICPLAYMRGRTFENAWIIADESQNMTPNQMLMLLTRIGDGSKMVVTGDIHQHDRGYERNGLSDLLYRMRGAQIEAPETPDVPEVHVEPVAPVSLEADVTAPEVVVPVAKPRWRVPDMDIVEFTYKDVERHPVIKTILKLYKDLQ